MLPKISIITPSFNQDQYLERTIQSVLNQNYPNLEYIIIDGGSADNSVEIIKKYEKHLMYWVSEPDNGQSHAINKGLEHATGDIINWLNSDDYLEPEALKTIVDTFKDESIDVVCGYANLIRTEGVIKKRSSEQGNNYTKAIATGHIMQPATFWKREIFNQFLPVNEDLNFMMDHYLWLQYLCKFGFERIKYIDDVLVNVLMHDDAKSVSNIELFYYDRCKIYDGLLNKIKPSSLALINKKDNLPIDTVNNIIVTKEIEQYLLKEVLFKRNEKGAVKMVRFNILNRLLLNYVLNLFK